MTDDPSPHDDKPAIIPPIPPGVTVTTLENGLTIIVREDHSAPVVSAQAWCKAGSIDEGKWLGGGLSHVLEHMLFKGTSTRKGSRIDQEIQDAGGYMNAYTSFDRTVYWINVPNTGATVALDILCDIMCNASIPEEDLAKEKDVIRREMDMNQDDPGQRSARRLFETAYTRSPYRYTIIGYPDIYNEVERDDIYTYYKEKYAPNNLFFVVVGDIKRAEAVKQIEEAFAKSKSKPLPPTVLPEEPRQTAARDITEEAAIEQGHLHCSWHIPDLRHPDVPLIDVLSTLLGSGRSSRLYREVRERQELVNGIDAWTYSPGNPGLFGVSAILNGDKFEAAREAIFAEVERLKNEPVTPEELGKAVRQFTAWTLASRKTMQGQAQDLGSNWMAASDLNFSARYLEVVKNTTPAKLQEVARKYFTTENRTCYALLPTGMANTAEHADDELVDHPIESVTLPNGLKLLLKEDHRLPFVEFRALFKGGVLAETEQNNGITQLTAKMLHQGTKSRNGAQIASEIESLGGAIDSYGGNNSFGVSAEVLSQDFSTGLDILCDVILHPIFPADALERERQIQLAHIRAQNDELLQSAGRILRHGLFGNSTYGLHSLGTEESVGKVTPEDLQAFHQTHAIPNNCVLAIYGDIQADKVKQAVDKALGSWKQGPDVLAKLPSPPQLNKVVRGTETRKKKQAVLILGFPGSTIHDPDRYPLELIQEACSDLGSRLFMRVREKLGLAYYVGAQNFLGLVPGYFAFYVGTDPNQVELVEKELLREAELLREEGLSEEELKRAKAKLIGQKKISRQDLGGYAMSTALDELYGLGYANVDTEDAHYESVTVEQIQATARKYLSPAALVIASITPE